MDPVGARRKRMAAAFHEDEQGKGWAASGFHRAILHVRGPLGLIRSGHFARAVPRDVDVTGSVRDVTGAVGDAAGNVRDLGRG